MVHQYLTVTFDVHNPNSEKGVHARRSLSGLDYSPLPRITGRSLLLALFVSMGGILFGYDTGQVSGFLEMPDFLERFGQTRDNGEKYFGNVRSGLIVALLSIGTLIGALVSAPIADRIGRKYTISFWNLIIAVGFIIQISANRTWEQVMMGRWVTGLGVGALSLLVPMYQAETSPPWIRGAMVCTYQLFITFGIFLAACFNYGTVTHQANNSGSWRIIIALGWIFTLVLGIGILFFPETPRYDYSRGNVERARETLCRVYGAPPPQANQPDPLPARMSMFNPPPAPKTPLGYRRLLAPNAGVRVSPLCLGGMSLGSKWADFTGKITKEAAFELLDAFVEAGGNFIDTANLYHFGESEEWIGEWMEQRGNRDRLVIATKYSGFNDGEKKDVNSMGNAGKSMHLGVRESLKRLRTSYIDVFYVHFWDYSTPVDEIMRGLHRHVLSGEILYPAVSDTPAWIVVQANAFARQHGYSPFVLYQGLWNVSVRDVEREVLPMLRKEGMGFAPWGVIGQGKFMSKHQLEERKASNEPIRGGEQSEKDVRVSEVLAEIGDELGASVTAVALAWAFRKMPYVFPIIGGRKVEHLKDNIKSLEITLTDAHVAQLEEVNPFDFGFPYDFFGRDPHLIGETTNRVMKASDPIQWVQDVRSIEAQRQ